MTKRQVRQFFNNERFERDNGAWWHGEVGFLLFDRSLLMLLGRNTDKPSLLLIQKLRDIPFLAFDEKRGVIVGSRSMQPDNK